MTRRQVLDLYFVEARSKLIDVAAFLDRAQRADGADDFRLKSFRAALAQLRSAAPNRARRVLASLSDPTSKPVKAAGNKNACGAWPGAGKKTEDCGLRIADCGLEQTASRRNSNVMPAATNSDGPPRHGRHS